ncbi:unnamed protein product [Triticum turgidum subsp. durum]|uniref:Uncharacterized protein n=1 Tax=Triticum turgidum subsp. durum TaxID=4567 RepID=A0A9R1QPJ5_TRITD|nr:unnamed protein product [Triticum turgidum subsp. durum]
MSLVKVPCSAHGTQTSLSGSNSGTEPQRVPTEDNTGSDGVNLAEGTQEYEQVPWMDKIYWQSLVKNLLRLVPKLNFGTLKIQGR